VSDADYGIDVTVESGLAYTQEAKRTLAIELAAKRLLIENSIRIFRIRR